MENERLQQRVAQLRLRERKAARIALGQPDRAQPRELHAERPQIVARKLCLHDPVRVRPRQPALAPGEVEQAFLHPLQMMGLEEQSLFPVNL